MGDLLTKRMPSPASGGSVSCSSSALSATSLPLPVHTSADKQADVQTEATAHITHLSATTTLDNQSTAADSMSPCADDAQEALPMAAPSCSSVPTPPNKNHPVAKLDEQLSQISLISPDASATQTVKWQSDDYSKGNALYCVFDGHGGRRAAEWCREFFFDTLKKTLADMNGKSPLDVLNATFLAVDYILFKENIHSGCTAAVCWLKNAIDPFEKAPKNVQIYTANAGDSRIVLCRNGKAMRLTCDHKALNNVDEQKRIKEAGGFIAHGRVNGIYAITRSLGDSDFKEFLIGNPYCTELTLGDADDFLILASDGLWDIIDDDVAVEMVRNEPDAATAASMLGNCALLRGSMDNITVIVVRFLREASAAAGSSGPPPPLDVG